MKHTNWGGFVGTLQQAFRKHQPSVLTGMGITGMITTTVLAVSATPGAMRKIDERKKKEKREKLTLLQLAQAAGLCYVPAAVTCAVSVGCLLGANSINQRRNTALATAYSFSESAFRTYKEKVVEAIGEKKEQAVRDEVDRETVKKNPVSSTQVIITGKGKTLCLDNWSQRYFEFDIEKLRRVENEINRRLIPEVFISLNEYYYEIGLPPLDQGYDNGWNSGDRLELLFSTQLTDDERPCLVITMDPPPKQDYFRASC